MNPETAVHYAKVGQVTLIYVTCLASILWYDTLSTLPREFNLVWIPFYHKHISRKSSSQDSFPNAGSSSSPLSCLSVFLFFIVRWICNVQFILIIWSIWRVWTPEACLKFFYVDSYMSAVVTSAATGIMALRLSAIWGRDPKIDIMMLISWVTLVACLLWASYFVIPVPNVPYCIAMQTQDHNLLALYIGPMIFDAIVLVLTFTRAIQLNYGYAGPILKLLIRDGTLYFLGTFTVNFLASVFELQNADPALKPINASLATIGTSIFSSRILFRMRELAKPANRTPSGGPAIPATFADGTNSQPDSQVKVGSENRTSANLSRKWSGIVSNFSREKSFNTIQAKNERRFSRRASFKQTGGNESRPLRGNSIQIETTMDREVDLELGTLSFSQRKAPKYDRHYSAASTLGNSYRQGEKGFDWNGSAEEDEVKEEGSPLPMTKDIGTHSRSISRSTSKTSGRGESFSSAQEFVKQPEKIQNNNASSSSPAHTHRHTPSDFTEISATFSSGRRSTSSELPPFTRKPSRDGVFQEFGFENQTSNQGGPGRGPKITTPGSIAL